MASSSLNICSCLTSHTSSPNPPQNRLSFFNQRFRLYRSQEQQRMGPQLEPVVQELLSAFQTFPATWTSSILSNLVIFTLGSPLLFAGLSHSGIASGFLLGTLTWRSFDSSGFLLVAAYFMIGTAVMKLKMAQKEAQGVAGKRKERRGPGSVFGSSRAGCVCALVYIDGAPSVYVSEWLKLGFVASFCTS